MIGSSPAPLTVELEAPAWGERAVIALPQQGLVLVYDAAGGGGARWLLRELLCESRGQLLQSGLDPDRLDQSWAPLLALSSAPGPWRVTAIRNGRLGAYLNPAQAWISQRRVTAEAELPSLAALIGLDGQLGRFFAEKGSSCCGSCGAALDQPDLSTLIAEILAQHRGYLVAAAPLNHSDLRQAGIDLAQYLEFLGLESAVVAGRLRRRSELGTGNTGPPEALIVAGVVDVSGSSAPRDLAEAVALLQRAGGTEVLFLHLTDRAAEAVPVGRWRDSQSCRHCGSPLGAEAPLRVKQRDLAGLLAEPVEVVRLWWQDLDEERRSFPEIDHSLAVLCGCGLGRLALGAAPQKLSLSEYCRWQVAFCALAALQNAVFVFDDAFDLLGEAAAGEIVASIKKFAARDNLCLVASARVELLAAADWVVLISTAEISAGPPAQLGAKIKAQSAPAPSLGEWAGRVLTMAEGRLAGDDLILEPGQLYLLSGAAGSGKSQFLRSLAAAPNKASSTALFKECRLLDAADYCVGQSCLSEQRLMRAVADEFARAAEARRRGLGAEAFLPAKSPYVCSLCRSNGFSDPAGCRDCGGDLFQSPVAAVRLRDRNINELLQGSLRDLSQFGGSDLLWDYLARLLAAVADFDAALMTPWAALPLGQRFLLRLLLTATELLAKRPGGGRTKPKATLLLLDHCDLAVSLNYHSGFSGILELLRREGITVVVTSAATVKVKNLWDEALEP